MPKTSIEVPEIGTVYLTKKRGQRTMRLRVDTKGRVQVSVPWIVPKAMTLDFIVSKKNWIKQQQSDYKVTFYDGMLLGKTLTLRINENSAAVRNKTLGKEIHINFPGTFDNSNPTQHLKIQKAITVALRTEAEKVLLPRLKEFSDLYGFTYKSGAVKHLVGRWGSCDSNRHILLSLFLIQLPIELIDYVLIHELTHTKYMDHSPSFWQHVESLCPDYKKLRKRMRGMQPRIYDAKAFMA